MKLNLGLGISAQIYIRGFFMDSLERIVGLKIDEVNLDESVDFVYFVSYKFKNCGQRYPAEKLKLCDLDYFNLLDFKDLFPSEAIFIAWYDFNSQIITDLEIYYLSNDFDVLFNDYYYIMKAISNGDAHKLTEGDTRYLGASRLNDKVSQPNSDKLANKRELVLKKKYLTKILNEITVKTCKF